MSLHTPSYKQTLLDNLKQEIQQHLVCPLKTPLSTLVFGDGLSTAQILIIGEAPGAKEEQSGIPFVGSAGKKLNTYLAYAGLTRNDVYIANVLKYRPPKNRKPTPTEMQNHGVYLSKQISIIQPKIILTFGSTAIQFILINYLGYTKKNISMNELHGKPLAISFPTYTTLVIPLYHPAALLYNRSLESVMIEDCTQVKTICEKIIK
jgi:uracil-DNA glycosylase